MAKKIVENWDDFVPKKKFHGIIAELFDYLNEANDCSRQGLRLFNSNLDCSSTPTPTPKARFLEDPRNYRWHVDVDICLVSEDVRVLVPCLMLLDVREKDLERSDYYVFCGGLSGERKDRSPSDNTIEVIIDEDHDGFFVTLTHCSLIDNSKNNELYDVVRDALEDEIFKEVGATQKDSFMMIHEKISEKFPMRLEEFDELFGEKIDKRIMIYSALS